MNLNIKQETVNRLLHRTELRCELESDGETPSRKQIIKSVAAKKGVDEKLVVVDNINQIYGQKAASAYVKVYESEKALKQIEPKYRMERDEKSESKKAAKEKAAAPAEAAPAEEAPKEEAPAEEKPKEEAPAEEKPAEEAPAAEEEKKE